MKLRRLSRLLAIGALGGLFVLTLYAVTSGTRLADKVAEERVVSSAHDQAIRLSNAIDYIVLLRRNTRLLEDLDADAEALQETLAPIDAHQARSARAHLEEIRYIIGVIGTGDPRDDGTVTLASQMRAHQSGLLAAMEELLADHDRDLIATLYRALLVFAVATISFGALCAAGFFVIGRRLRQPLASIDHTISELAAGNLAARADVRRRDELGELGEHINDMARQRQQDEEDLRKSEERFRQLTENIREVFWLTDPEKSRMLYVSPSYEETWGRSRDALYDDPLNWMDAIHPDDRARVRAAASRQADGNYHEVYRIVRPDGGIRWISDRAFPVRDSDGRIYRIAGLAEDVTEHRRAEIALRERMKELACLYRVLELTTDSRLEPGEIYEGIAGLLPQSMQYEADTVASVTIGKETFSSAGWREPVDTLSAEIDGNGESYGTVTVGYLSAHDEEAAGEGPFLAEERALLEGVATHIGRMLQNRAMASSLRRAQRLEAVGQLTGGVAHDFNNLLTVIMGNAELLNDEPDNSSRQAESLAMIMNAAARGSELTSHLLAFARRQPLAPQSLDVNSLIAGMDELLRRTLGEHIRIELMQSPDLWQAMADRAQLESALLNLLLNARDAMPDGGSVTIETTNTRLSEEYVTKKSEVRPGEYVMIAVSDTGEGMPAEVLAKALEPFYTTKDPGMGTGLGLSMVYGFAKQSGGHLDIYSEPGHGTTVKLYLPRAGAAPQERQPETEPLAEGGEETILLVEDDAPVRQIAHRALASLGYRVIEAADGQEALRQLDANPDIDLLFTDLIMPGGLSGRELADEASRRRPGLKIVYTSGYTENAIVHHGRLDPGVILLTKPYRRADLAAILRRALRD
ncbi:MAG: PAS domain-containing protein [Woeseiaceae bacterium]|nr:PAS domain-containing protein [Woeseiaceae bacterium]